MGAVPGSLCWKKQPERARGHWHALSHPRGAAFHPKKCPKKPRWSRELHWAAKETGCIPSPGTFVAGAPLIPLLAPSQSHSDPPRPHNSQSPPPPKGRIPTWGRPQTPHPPGDTHGCPCTGTGATVAVPAAGLGVSPLPSRSCLQRDCSRGSRINSVFCRGVNYTPAEQR